MCSGSQNLAELRPEVKFYEEVHVWMAKADALDRQARGEPIPEEIQRLLGDLIAAATGSAGVLDVYEAEASTGSNMVRQRAFSARGTELMNKYTNQQLTSAEIMAAFFEVMLELQADANRGAHFTPPLTSDELAFYDAVAQNESARVDGIAVCAGAHLTLRNVFVFAEIHVGS